MQSAIFLDPPPPFNTRQTPSAPPNSCHPCSMVSTSFMGSCSDSKQKPTKESRQFFPSLSINLKLKIFSSFRCHSTSVVCNLSQFLTLLVSVCTLTLLLMTLLVTSPMDATNGHSEYLPPRPEVSLWLQQISGFTWMPNYFQTWSSELNSSDANNGSHVEVMLEGD